MTQMTLSVAIQLPGKDEEQHDKEKCPFCKKDAPKKKGVAVIGKDNNSNTLGNRLPSKEDYLFEDSEHGLYSVEAHHLICGNEILGDHEEVEKHLITQEKAATQGGEGLIENALGDVPWDVNEKRNGIWLPSVPDVYRRAKNKEPDVWWGKQSKKSGRNYLKQKAKNKIAFIVMMKQKLQFHKGSHKNAAPPHKSYVKFGKDKLDDINIFVDHYKEECPIKDNGKKRGESPIYPPMGLANVLDLLSDTLKNELKGHPKTWNYFISKFALKCNTWSLGLTKKNK